MGAKLVGEQYKKPLKMSDLKDGEVAIIIDSRSYDGRIVQRYGDIGVSIGLPEGNSFTEISKNSLAVRVLTIGELIEII
jgi:hypothetical protein